MIVEVAGQKYSVDRGLWTKWEKINNGQLAQLDEDRVYLVDGREGSGKSVFTMQQAGVIDPTLFTEALENKRLDRICFTGEETLKAIRNTKSTKERTKVIIFDEAFRGLASSSVLSKINRQIIQALMEMRQNNLVLFIVLPSFLMLDKYAAMHRGNSLFHIHKPKVRGDKKLYHRNFYVYNYAMKGALLQMDKRKAWMYPIRSRTRGKFFNKYPGGAEFEKLYREKKAQAFRDVEKTLEGETEESKYALQRNRLILWAHEELKAKYIDMSRVLGEGQLKMAPNSVSEAGNRSKRWLRTLKTP